MMMNEYCGQTKYVRGKQYLSVIIFYLSILIYLYEIYKGRVTGEKKSSQGIRSCQDMLRYLNVGVKHSIFTRCEMRSGYVAIPVRSFLNTQVGHDVERNFEKGILKPSNCLMNRHMT